MTTIEPPRPRLTAAQKKRLSQLADEWAESALRDLASGGEIGDWRADAGIPLEVSDDAYRYLMDRFADWTFVAGAIVRMRAER